MPALAIAALVAFTGIATSLLMACFYAPTAQCDAGCLAQKIFYFHVPSAYVMYLGVGACALGSLGYLWQRTAFWDAVAQAGGEIAVAFSTAVLTTGPLWGRKAWGAYWVWDPRLTTTLLASLIFVAYLGLRSSGGEAEKRFSAALGLLGAAIVPVIHYSVQLWRGTHPTVIGRGGGGLRHPAMKTTFAVSFTAFTILAAVLLFVRMRQLLLEARLEALRNQALSAGLIEDDE